MWMYSRLVSMVVFPVFTLIVGSVVLRTDQTRQPFGVVNMEVHGMMTAKQLDKCGDYVYPLVRIVVGFLFACHGAQKLFGVLGSQPEIHDPEGLVAGLIEFFGGSLVALGLGARVAAFLASGEM